MAAPVFVFGETVSPAPFHTPQSSSEPVANYMAAIPAYTGNMLYSPQYGHTCPYAPPTYCTYSSPLFVISDMSWHTHCPEMIAHSNSGPGETTMPINQANVQSTSNTPPNDRSWLKAKLRIEIRPNESADVNAPVKRYVTEIKTLENRAVPPDNRMGVGRTVDVQSLENRRAELLRNNKPVATYTPTILHTWTIMEYLRHNKLFIANQNKVPGPRLQLKDNRTVVTNKYNASELKMLNPMQRNDRWWIVCDTQALLHDMHFLLDLVESDSTCRMYVPFEVLHDLTKMTERFRNAYMKIPARRLREFLDKNVGTNKPIVCQSVLEAEDLDDHPLAAKDAAINCCLKFLNMHYYAALITDDPKRVGRARSISIPTFFTEHAKDLAEPCYDNCRTLGVTITLKV